MNRTIARLSALLVAGACVGAACGDKVVFDGNADGMSTSGARSGATASSSSSGEEAGSGGSTGAGGCDPASHTIDVTDFNVSCGVGSDCVPVFVGNLYTNCTCPLFSAINVADKMKFDAEVKVKGAGTPPGSCNCPISTGICVQGKCAVQVP